MPSKQPSNVILRWTIDETSTKKHYRIVVAPAGDQWMVSKQKRRGVTDNWTTEETWDSTEKPSANTLGDSDD